VSEVIGPSATIRMSARTRLTQKHVDFALIQHSDRLKVSVLVASEIQASTPLLLTATYGWTAVIGPSFVYRESLRHIACDLKILSQLFEAPGAPLRGSIISLSQRSGVSLTTDVSCLDSASQVLLVSHRYSESGVLDVTACARLSLHGESSTRCGLTDADKQIRSNRCGLTDTVEQMRTKIGRASCRERVSS
jgi:hypothetical protein